jgi:hypothetical protein
VAEGSARVGRRVGVSQHRGGLLALSPKRQRQVRPYRQGIAQRSDRTPGTRSESRADLS